jgi:PKD repeat protein
MPLPRPHSIRRSVPWAALFALIAFVGIGRASEPVSSFTFEPIAPSIGTTVNFTDTSTENPTSWFWSFGDPTTGLQNTSDLQNPFFTYNRPGTYTVSLTVANNDGIAITSHSLSVSDSSATCTEAVDRLCLNNARFSASADWTKPDGTTGHGNAMRLTGDSGYFWFFQASNIELVVKALNGCGIDNAYWVFAAGLTNVRVVLNVKDEQTGIIYERTNEQGGAFIPILDTEAFAASCP